MANYRFTKFELERAKAQEFIKGFSLGLILGGITVASMYISLGGSAF